MSKLSDCQMKAVERLKREGLVKWVDVTPAETRTFNSLVKRGIADRVMCETSASIKGWVINERN